MSSSFVQQINQHPAPIDQPDKPPRLPDNADNHIPATGRYDNGAGGNSDLRVLNEVSDVVTGAYLDIFMRMNKQPPATAIIPKNIGIEKLLKSI